MQRGITRCFSSSLQLASLPEVVACRAAYDAKDFAKCLPAALRAVEIASNYVPGSRDFVVLSAVAGRCSWQLGQLPGAEAHLRAAAEVDVRLKPYALRVAVESAPVADRLDVEDSNWSELNSLLANAAADGGGVAVPESVSAALESTEQVSAWVSAGEASVLGRLVLPDGLAQELLTRALDASVPSSPSFVGLRPRALQSLGTSYFRAQKAVSAEGLFRAAQDAWLESEVVLQSPRVVVQRIQGSLAYGDFLHKWENREREGDVEYARARALLQKYGLQKTGGDATKVEISSESAAWSSLVMRPLNSELPALIDELWSS